MKAKINLKKCKCLDKVHIDDARLVQTYCFLLSASTLEWLRRPRPIF